MNRKLAIIIGLQAFLIVMLFWVLVFYGKDEYEALTQESEEQIETPNRVISKQGMTVITIDAATQTQSEIKTSPIKASTHQSTVTSYGNVVNIDSLMELRARYIAAKAEAQLISTSAARNKSEYARLHALNLDDKNVSDKVVAAALADVKADEAKLFAAEASAKNIADTMRQTWGPVLTQFATNNNSGGLFENLINYNEALIQITLPFNSPEPATNSEIKISPSASPTNNISARYLSRAPQNTGAIQGKTYFYHAKHADLRAGMQVTVISLSTSSNIKSKSSGIIIPNEAVIWYGGKPWVYHKIGNDQFSRLPINTDVETENGWFQQGDSKVSLKPSDEVVTSGAQLLLSEEFKSQITNENED
ncbi:MAG: hypothetical protein ABIP37_03790 [Methylotenera sp.]